MRKIGWVFSLLFVAPAFSQVPVDVEQLVRAMNPVGNGRVEYPVHYYHPTSSTTQTIGSYTYTTYDTPAGPVNASQRTIGVNTHVDYETPQGTISATYRTIGGITHGTYSYSYGYGNTGGYRSTPSPIEVEWEAKRRACDEALSRNDYEGYKAIITGKSGPDYYEARMERRIRALQTGGLKAYNAVLREQGLLSHPPGPGVP